MKTGNKIEKILIFLAGVYFLFTFIQGLYQGEFIMLKSGSTITEINDPYKYWAVVWLQGIIIIIIFYILFGNYIKQYIENKKTNTRSIRTIESYLVEVEVLLQYGDTIKALEVIAQGLSCYPDDPELLNIRKLVSNKTPRPTSKSDVD